MSEVVWIEIHLELHSDSGHVHSGLLPTQQSGACGKLDCGRKLAEVATWFPCSGIPGGAVMLPFWYWDGLKNGTAPGWKFHVVKPHFTRYSFHNELMNSPAVELEGNFDQEGELLASEHCRLNAMKNRWICRWIKRSEKYSEYSKKYRLRLRGTVCSPILSLSMIS